MVIADDQFVEGIVEAIRGLLIAYSNATSVKAKNYFKRNLSNLWNELGNQGMQINSTRYSVDADIEFKQVKKQYPMILKNVNNLEDLYWNQIHSVAKKGSNRYNALKEYKKRIFWEHGYTRGDFVREAISIHENSNNEESDLKKLVKEHQIVWITTKENEKLNLHHKSKRKGSNWQKVYQQLGIKLK